MSFECHLALERYGGDCFALCNLASAQNVNESLMQNECIFHDRISLQLTEMFRLSFDSIIGEIKVK